jgi:hypothetical protein
LQSKNFNWGSVKRSCQEKEVELEYFVRSIQNIQKRLVTVEDIPVSGFKIKMKYCFLESGLAYSSILLSTEPFGI